VSDPFLERRLKAALEGGTTFDAFEALLDGYPVEQRRWRSYLREMLLQEALRQLDENDVETTIAFRPAG
jgi:hypothetical protein